MSRRGVGYVIALTLLVVNAYAAAMVGRLRSVPLTFVGGKPAVPGTVSGAGEPDGSATGGPPRLSRGVRSCTKTWEATPTEGRSFLSAATSSGRGAITSCRPYARSASIFRFREPRTNRGTAISRHPRPH